MKNGDPVVDLRGAEVIWVIGSAWQRLRTGISILFRYEISKNFSSCLDNPSDSTLNGCHP